MYIYWVLCQVGMSHRIVLRPYVHILGPMSGGKVPEYSTRLQEYQSGFLCQVGRSQSIVMGFLCIYPGLYGRWEGTRV